MQLAAPNPEAGWGPRWLRTAALVNLAAVLERCDEQMLPAVYRFVGAAWNATPTQLGYITLCRALVQALSSPLGGIAGQFMHRGRVLGAGCLLWSACTAAFAACSSLPAGAAVWAVNGLGLALVLPSAQSLIADIFAATARGRAFGVLYCTGALGGMLGALYATNMGAHRPLGLEGWRFAFVSLAAVSAAAGAANLALTEDPRHDHRHAGGQQYQQYHALVAGGKECLEVGNGPGAAAEGVAPVHRSAGGEGSGQVGQPAHRLGARAGTPGEGPNASGSNSSLHQRAHAAKAGTLLGPAKGAAGGGASLSLPPWQAQHGKPASVRQHVAQVVADVAAVLRIPTFLIIVLQGIAGSIPWSALVFLTLYLQLCGMSDAQASSLVALFLAGTAVGGLIGGCVGDAAAKRWPHHGRIAVTQFSVSVGIPFAVLVFKGLPRDGSHGTVAIYAAVLLAFALLKAWPAPACNNPVFAEIVPDHQRNLVYAFDRCFEGAIAACAAPLVGLLAEHIFGYTGAGTVTHDRERDLANAGALANALLAFLVVPWCFTFSLYTGLHWTYPADKAAALRRQLSTLRERCSTLEEPGEVLIDRLEASSPLGSAASIEMQRSTSSALPAAAMHVPGTGKAVEEGEPLPSVGEERAALLPHGAGSAGSS